AWKKEGFVFSTPSNEAVKLYDAAVSQIIQYYDNESLGGLEKTIHGVIEADPNYVMGYLLKSGMPVIDADIERNPELKKDYDFIMDLVAKGKVTEHEKKHALAFRECFHGDTAKACVLWEDILTDHPTDIFALRLLQETYIVLGKYPQLCDTVASVFPSWKPETPLYSYLHGMYAFGLEETKHFHEAEKYAIKVDNPLTGHNFWHWALYHVEKGEFEAALDLFDNEVGRRACSSSLFHLINTASLLYRLEMQGVNIGDRWDQMLTHYAQCTDTHLWMFVDAHMIMCTLGAKREDLTLKLLKSLKEYAKNGSGTNCDVTREVGVALCEAFELADKGHFDQAVELLKPIRYDLYKLGGSNAQRDVFKLFFINAAMMSSRKDHRKLARRLLAERKASKENAPMTDRLVARAMANHVD
ncbi:hypothetical protein QZH41_012619, partial [Actinostola sp. cb2023]